MQSLKIIRLLIHFFRYEKKQEESSLHVSHTVRNFEFFYEPFYISLDTAPPFDERFIGYGFTRNTQVGKILMLHIVLTKTLFRKSKTMKKKYFNFQKGEMLSQSDIENHNFEPVRYNHHMVQSTLMLENSPNLLQT